MRVWLSALMIVPLVFASLGGCEMIGVPDEWCGLSSAGFWSAGIMGLTALWAPGRLPV